MTDGPAVDFRLLWVVNAGPEGIDARRIEAGLRGGVTWLQLRGEALSTAELVAAGRELMEAAASRAVPVIINNRPDVALILGAAGVHLGPSDLPLGAGRRLMPHAVLGASARDAGRVRLAEAAPADYLGVGAVRASTTKPKAIVVGVEGIASVAAGTRLPVVAIGGVRPEDAPALKRAGAAGVAVASALGEAEDPEAAARAFRAAWGD